MNQVISVASTKQENSNSKRRLSPQHLALLTPDFSRAVKSAARQSNGVWFIEEGEFSAPGTSAQQIPQSVCVCVVVQTSIGGCVTQKKGIDFGYEEKSTGNVLNQTDASSNLARQRGRVLK